MTTETNDTLLNDPAPDPVPEPQPPDPAPGQQPAQTNPQGAPEQYQFSAPEGVTFDGTVIEAFSEVARDLNLPQEQAQKVLDKVAPVMAQRQTEQVQAVRSQWVSDARADKEIGGDKLNENLAVAKKALDTFASPELRQMLDESGLGDHPEVIRLFYRTGLALGEDRFVAGSQGNAAKTGDARRLYCASNMNP